MAALVHTGGMIIAQQIAWGHYPRVVAIPVSLLISQLRTPSLAISVFSCALRELALRSEGRREPLRRR